MSPIPEDRVYRLRQARTRASGLVAPYCAAPPVDVERFAREVAGLDVWYDAEMPDTDSGLLRRDLRAMSINTNHPPGRRRFSIAHELGHWYLHSDEALVSDRSLSLSELRRLLDPEADCFAAEFLMPVALLRKVVRPGFLLVELATFFQVSNETMWYQLKYHRLAARLMRA